MNKDDFLAYVETYNSGSIDDLLSHYTPDLTFQSFGQPPKHGEEAFAFLRGIREDFEDRIVPVHVLVDGNLVALEAMLEMEARRDLPHFFGGARKKGERSRMHMLAFYEMNGDLIRAVRLCGWPAA